MMLAAIVTPAPDGGTVAPGEMPRPVLTPQSVLIRVRAAGLNRGEIIARKAMREGKPVIGGIEFAGEIAEVGSAVSGFSPGDRVMGRGTAAQAQYVLSDPNLLMRVPQELDFEQAAAIPNVFVTAHDALVTNAGLKAGESVLINAASSGIGTAAIQIAKFLRAGTIIGVSRSRAKLKSLEKLGLDHSVATDTEDLATAVMRITAGKGADIVIDCLGGAALDGNLHAMALGGRLINIGRMAGTSAPLDLNFLALRRLKLIGVTFRTRTHDEHVACVQNCWRDLGSAFADGKLFPLIDRVFPLEKIAEAQDYMQTNAQTGKIILAVS